MRFRLFFFIVYLLFFSKGFSQKSEEFLKYKTMFPQENLVETYRENIIDIGIKNNDLVISESKLSKKIYLNQAAKYQSKQKVYISDFFSLDKITASSYHLYN